MPSPVPTLPAWPAWQRMGMVSQAGWGPEPASHCSPVATCCSRPGALGGAGYQTHPAVTILWGICIPHWDEPKEGRKRRKKWEEPAFSRVPSPHVAWKQHEIPVLILLMSDPKPRGFLPCPIAHGRHLSPVHPAGIPQSPTALTTLPNSRAHSQ